MSMQNRRFSGVFLLAAFVAVASTAFYTGCKRGGGEAKLVPVADPAVVAAFKTPPARTPEDNEKIRVAWGKFQSAQVKHNFLLSLSWTGSTIPMMEDLAKELEGPLFTDIRTRAYQLEAHSLMQEDKKAEAIELYNKTAQETADPNQRYNIMQNIANLYGLMGKTDEQISVFLQMMDEVELPAFKGAVVNQLVSLYAQEKRFDEAMDLFDKVVAQPDLLSQPITLNLLNRLIPSLTQVGREDDALKVVSTLEEKVAAYNKDMEAKKQPIIDLNTNPQYQQALMYEMRIHRQRGDMAKATEKVLPLLDKTQNQLGFVTELMQVAQAQAAKKDYAGALKLIERLRELNTDPLTQGKLLFAQADLEFQNGQKTDGAKHLREVVAMLKDDPYKQGGVRFYLALKLKEDGDKKGAVKVLQGLVNPPNPFTSVAQEEIRAMGETPSPVVMPAPVTTPTRPPAPPARGGKPQGGILPD